MWRTRRRATLEPARKRARSSLAQFQCCRALPLPRPSYKELCRPWAESAGRRRTPLRRGPICRASKHRPLDCAKGGRWRPRAFGRCRRLRETERAAAFPRRPYTGPARAASFPRRTWCGPCRGKVMLGSSVRTTLGRRRPAYAQTRPSSHCRPEDVPAARPTTARSSAGPRWGPRGPRRRGAQVWSEGRAPLERQKRRRRWTRTPAAPRREVFVRTRTSAAARPCASALWTRRGEPPPNREAPPA
mmetsp:Transcript_4300/g.13483  ORF Transcript_4300/g.13483 Transcript_4300/m.13483 type:complete len:245 (+) Transcript_4300:1565-2299(+)